MTATSARQDVLDAKSVILAIVAVFLDRALAELRHKKPLLVVRTARRQP
jgi:hypothetical protein